MFLHRSFAWVFAVLAVGLGTVACSGGGGGGSSPGGGATDTGGGGDETALGDDAAGGTDDTGGGDRGPYPDGPYAAATGAIMGDLVMDGYLNLDPTVVSNTAEFGTVTLADLRAKTNVPYAFIHEVGFF
jgi:hypothetical protein